VIANAFYLPHHLLSDAEQPETIIKEAVPTTTTTSIRQLATKAE
jgi:hypothetical protein